MSNGNKILLNVLGSICFFLIVGFAVLVITVDTGFEYFSLLVPAVILAFYYGNMGRKRRAASTSPPKKDEAKSEYKNDDKTSKSETVILSAEGHDVIEELDDEVDISATESTEVAVPSSEPNESYEGCSWYKSKFAVSIVLGLCLLTIFLPVTRHNVLDNSLFSAADQNAEEYIEDALVRATAAFAIARVINAAVSILQESEIQISVLGNGASLALFEVLDPINDLAERFSWVMLLSIASLGIQRFLIEISSWLSIDVLAVFGLVFWIAGLWVARLVRIDLVGIGKKLIFLALVIRFAMPCMSYTNDYIYKRFLEQKYDQAIKIVNTQTDELKGVKPLDAIKKKSYVVGQKEDGWWEKWKKTLSPSTMLVKFNSLVSKVKKIVEALIANLLTLFIIFLINTVILPIGFLWVLVYLFRLFTNSNFGLTVEQQFRTRIVGTESSK